MTFFSSFLIFVSGFDRFIVSVQFFFTSFQFPLILGIAFLASIFVFLGYVSSNFNFLHETASMIPAVSTAF